MCGIAGIVDFAGRPMDRGLLDRLCGCLAHRGPDDRGTWVHEAEGWSVGLAHTRLAVIDPAPEAHQPMLTPEGRWAIAYNGELYNYRELRERLPAPAVTSSDTEVFLRACGAWGPAALRRFDGMWAAAVVDAANRTGHISRDPIGIKPLYYAVHDRRLVFASELATLVWAVDWPLEIDTEAVACYLHLGFVPHPLTVYRRVRKLPPGHVLRFDANGAGEPERYYQLARPAGRPPEYGEACEELRRLIEAAVVRQCVADVPLGAFLSGGLDSSVVVACMAGQAGSAVRTFCIGYADHPRYDETNYARMVARHLATEHREFRLTFAEALAAVEPMLNHLGEPFADSSLLPTSLVSRHTRQHVTVALSGDGGDELFGGYWRYLGHHYLDRYRRLPPMLRRGVIEPLLRLVPDARSTRRLDRLRQVRKLLRGDAADPMDRHLAWARFLEPELATGLLGDERAGAAFGTIRQTYREPASGWCTEDVSHLDPLQRILLADLAVGLPGDMLFKVDTASMYHSLEVRVPLLSTDVVQFVSGLPLEYKIRGTTGKRILRDAFRGVLPDAVFRRRKMGFEVPVGEFLRRELRDMYASTVTPEALADLGIDAEAAAQAYDDHLHRRCDRTELLWALLVLCWWKRGG
ncbi:MAG: asparagine synthase (glutamine-hydrolyzing) [Planctomycetes bacterium]|nr:asparagine synthase (glutamine-hydrolyzing) [Planctomycetota bacterium]